MHQSDSFQSKLRRRIIDTLGQYASENNIHKVDSLLLDQFPDGVDFVFGNATPSPDLEKVILDDANTFSERVRQQARRYLPKHISLDAPIKQLGEGSYAARIGDMIAARTLVSIQDKIWTDEIVSNARFLIIQKDDPRRKSKQAAGRRQVADAVELHLRSGISFAAALAEIQVAQGVKVKPSTAAAWWDVARERMKIRHSYMLNRPRPDLMDGRRKKQKSVDKPAPSDRVEGPPKIKAS